MISRLRDLFRTWYLRIKYGDSRLPVWARWGMLAGALLLVALTIYTVYLDFIVRARFEGVRWAIPARVYARPLELYPGKKLPMGELLSELRLLGYSKIAQPDRAGSYYQRDNVVDLTTRPFQFWDGAEPQASVRLSFGDDVLEEISGRGDGSAVELVRLDPAIVGSIYPAHNEDRLLLQLKEVPQLLIDALLVIEDQHFYQHWGIRPQSMLRAIWTNLRAGSAVAGGSTLTQQLVKNFYLSNARTLRRKFNEAIMSLLVEFHYQKDEILEAYMNEIFLGQDGHRSINGFGLASQFYFQKNLQELQPAEIALLVALVKGASYYDPRRHPDRAKQRRDLVLSELEKAGKLDKEAMRSAQRASLGVMSTARSGVTEFPAFIDLVRRQLRRDYKEADLTSQGLQIHTTLDPLIQLRSENAVADTLNALEKQRRIAAGKLQAAAVVTSVDGGELLAVVGDRNPRFAGFNRVIDALRPIGSLIKPVIFLTALERPERYTLATPLDDTAFQYTMQDGQVWEPKNYDKEEHGAVPLYRALANSYNLSTAKLGLDLGVGTVIDTLRRMGIDRQVAPYPSLFLGAAALSPIEVAQIYHTFANNGFRVDLRAIRAVLTADGDPVQRYPLSMQQVFEPGASYLINYALQEVVRDGTAKYLPNIIGQEMTVAGKTGTSDDLRDSWFAGFTGDRMAVTWVGNDDNMPVGLTGASGAMVVWGHIMQAMDTQPLLLTPPDDVETAWIDGETFLRGGPSCQQALELPFIKGSEPKEAAPCGEGVLNKTLDLFRGIFN